MGPKVRVNLKGPTPPKSQSLKFRRATFWLFSVSFCLKFISLFLFRDFFQLADVQTENLDCDFDFL